MKKTHLIKKQTNKKLSNNIKNLMKVYEREKTRMKSAKSSRKTQSLKRN